MAHLDSRGVIRVSGEEAEHFLQNLLTCDVSATALHQPAFGALLSPQGKILFDFIMHRTGAQEFLFDLRAEKAGDFVKRLGFYRLRAKVAIDNRSGDLAVLTGWEETPVPENSIASGIDPRLPALGWRAIVRRDDLPASTATEDEYHAHRISLSIPEGGVDFTFEDTFPHDSDMDQLHGISFDKGCYIGQEVVSRMQHRGTARTRTVSARYDGTSPPVLGSDITADGKRVGVTGSGANGRVVTMVRIDKVHDARESGTPLQADGQTLIPGKPDWAAFDF